MIWQLEVNTLFDDMTQLIHYLMIWLEVNTLFDDMTDDSVNTLFDDMTVWS